MNDNPTIKYACERDKPNMSFMNNKVLLGVAPTRRDDPSFSLEKALKYKKELFALLKKWNIEFVDIEDCCSDGFLVSNQDVEIARKKFTEKEINALFIPHMNFGCEGASAQLARVMGLPVLLWGVRDKDNFADSHAQCGLFATGKAMRHSRVPFTYIPTCFMDSPLLKRGIDTFIAAANVVKEFRRCRVLQIGPRPESFWSVMVNEAELLEKFDIHVYPISINEISDRTLKQIADHDPEVEDAVRELKAQTNITVNEDVVWKSASLKIAIKRYAEETCSNTVAIQCWYTLQQTLGIWPCAAGSMLASEGLPVVCETDIHGAISNLIADAASMGKNKSFIVDWAIRHPEEANCEEWLHCSIWPVSVFKEKPSLVTRPGEKYKDMGGGISAEVKHGEVSFLRFDGDNGQYSILLGNAVGKSGPKWQGGYLWVEVPDLLKLEDKIVRGPYVHHCTGIHGNILPVIEQALPYLAGVNGDYAFDEQETVAKRWLLTEEEIVY